jgi:hypothetical protein
MEKTQQPLLQAMQVCDSWDDSDLSVRANKQAKREARTDMKQFTCEVMSSEKLGGKQASVRWIKNISEVWPVYDLTCVFFCSIPTDYQKEKTPVLEYFQKKFSARLHTSAFQCKCQ